MRLMAYLASSAKSSNVPARRYRSRYLRVAYDSDQSHPLHPLPICCVIVQSTSITVPLNKDFWYFRIHCTKIITICVSIVPMRYISRPLTDFACPLICFILFLFPFLTRPRYTHLTNNHVRRILSVALIIWILQPLALSHPHQWRSWAKWFIIQISWVIPTVVDRWSRYGGLDGLCVQQCVIK